MESYTIFELAEDLGGAVIGLSANDDTAQACCRCGLAARGNVLMELAYPEPDVVLCRSCCGKAINTLLEDGVDLALSLRRPCPPLRCPLHHERMTGRAIPVCAECASYGMLALARGVRPLTAWLTPAQPRPM